ncbi:MAG: nuclear transport factor 2 family protein [Bacteroidetes bacterium]|nr:nuclear transport factor 2 family protein [Bacteroidota bacterium]MBL6942789.1 nuclear transport factor 2 family protein [Bacteroidales bacterium]
MKLIYSTLVLCILLVASSSCDQKKEYDCKEDTEAIENLLENYILANENQDFDLIENIWAPDDDIILYGTDSDERLMGWSNIRDAIKNQFSHITDTYISASNQLIKINCTGNTAWFAETLNYNYMYKGVAHKYEGLRFTGVVEKINGDWVLVQAHLSVPASVGIGKK